jgi:glycosyltransferase involved in cell wall biosynthesis
MGKKVKKIAFISTYIPRECGIATYTKNLMDAIKENDPSLKMEVFAMDDGGHYKYDKVVKGTIRQENKSDYRKIADTINKSDVDVVSIQHEFGIYGGFNGRLILELLKRIKKTKIITFHTVPIAIDKPYKIRAKRYKSRTKLLSEIAKYVDGATVMNEIAKKYLIKYARFFEYQIMVIPHGAPALSRSKQEKYIAGREELPLPIKKNDFVMSTFGLISPKKGLEYVIKAMPRIIKANPEHNIKYLILGRTHPQKPLRYQNYLKNLTKKLKLENNVLFLSHYLDKEEIFQFLVNCNVYITPYYAKEQSSSGTLSYALACGRCIVSTPYVFAEDIIKRKHVGELVDFKSPELITLTINKLLANPSFIEEYAKKSHNVGESIEWGKIGNDFLKLYNRKSDNENSNNSGAQ